jgi:hypothetical protein
MLYVVLSSQPRLSHNDPLSQDGKANGLWIGGELHGDRLGFNYKPIVCQSVPGLLTHTVQLRALLEII